MSIITIERTVDLELVRSIMAHPKVYRGISDDFSPISEEFVPSNHPSILYLLVLLDGNPAGVFMLVPQNGICWEIHTCLLPVLWGCPSNEAALRCSEWVFTNTVCEKIITNVPEYNRAALKFAKRAGMVQFGVNESSFKHAGRLYNQIMLGLTKTMWKEITCQQP